MYINAEKIISEVLRERLEKLKEMTELQCQDGNWNYDPYMHGMANGLIFSVNLMEGDFDPGAEQKSDRPFLKAPEKWKKDIVSQVLKESGWIKTAIDFPSQKAYEQYMKQHPEADPKRHRVVKKEISPHVKDKLEQKKKELKEPEQKENLKKKLEQKKKEVKKQPQISFDNTTKEQRLSHVSYKDIQGQMSSNLNKIKKPVKFEKVEGKFTKKHLRTLISNTNKSLTSYSSYLADDSKELADSYVSTINKILSKHSDEFSKQDSKDLDSLLRDSVDKLVHQEIESNRQSFTDHGIRHIVKNIQTQQKILSELEKTGSKISGRQKLLSIFTMVNHDIGYTAPPVRQGGLDGIKSSGDHKHYSKKITAEQKDIWNSDKIFSEKEFEQALDLIEHHDDTSLDISDPLRFSTSLSDNLSLFQEQKLPGMFRYVKNNKKMLTDLGDSAAKAMKAKKDGDDNKFKEHSKRFEDLRDKLHKEIDDTKLNSNLKRDLKSATNELNLVTPKFVLGTLAGSISGIKSKGKTLQIDIKHNEFDSFLQKHFDMGQKQTKNLLEAYGVKDFTKNEYDLGGVVKIKVK